METVDNIFENIPKDLPKELVECILKSPNVTIERIISDGHTSPKEGWYDSQTNEWVILLQGKATLTFQEGKKVILNVGDSINIPPLAKHKVSYTSQDEKTIWLVVHY